MIDYTNTQTVFDSIKSADNSALWSMAGEIARMAMKQSKAKKEDGGEITQEYIDSLNIDELLSDPSKLRTRVLASLIKGSDAGNHQASDKLAKLAGIENAQTDLEIGTVDYSDALIDCPHCGENVRRPILADDA